MLNHTNNYNEISLKDTEPGSHSNIVNILVYINKFPIKKWLGMTQFNSQYKRKIYVKDSMN